MIVVADASPLIALARIERLDLLRVMFGKLLLPDAVWIEVAEEGLGRPGAELIPHAHTLTGLSGSRLPIGRWCRCFDAIWVPVNRRPSRWRERSPIRFCCWTIGWRVPLPNAWACA